jgi:prepilin-type processing-associated H-X9-DG protein
MGAFTIPGTARPAHHCAGFPPGSKLTGAINVAFYDGHVESANPRNSSAKATSAVMERVSGIAKNVRWEECRAVLKSRRFA